MSIPIPFEPKPVQKFWDNILNHLILLGIILEIEEILAHTLKNNCAPSCWPLKGFYWTSVEK